MARRIAQRLKAIKHKLFEFITHTLRHFCQRRRVRRNLDRQLAKFLRKKRGSLSYAAFGKKLGVSHTTLHRIERGEHHITLDKLETILVKLRVRLKHIFPNEF
jgi:transcriptional regulator with XRE-family HTH domain